MAERYGTSINYGVGRIGKIKIYREHVAFKNEEGESE